MFIREPFKAPPGSTTSYEVRYGKGRKPFPSLDEARAFAKAEKATPGGWAEVAQLVRIVVDKR